MVNISPERFANQMAQEFVKLGPTHVSEVDSEISTLILISNKKFYGKKRQNFSISFYSKPQFLRTLKLLERAYHLHPLTKESQLTERSQGNRGSYKIYFDEKFTAALRQLGVADSSGQLRQGLSNQVNLGKLYDTAAALRVILMKLSSFRGEELDITVDNFIMSNAVIGLFRKLGLRPDRKTVRGQKVLIFFHDRTSVANLLEILGAKKTAEDYRRLYPTVAPNVLEGETRILVQKVYRPKSTEVMVLRVEKALEIIPHFTKIQDKVRDAALVRIKYPKMSIEDLGKNSDPPSTKDAIAGRLRRLIQQADHLADQYDLEDTLSYALRRLNRYLED